MRTPAFGCDLVTLPHVAPFQDNTYRRFASCGCTIAGTAMLMVYHLSHTILLAQVGNRHGHVLFSVLVHVGENLIQLKSCLLSLEAIFMMHYFRE